MAGMPDPNALRAEAEAALRSGADMQRKLGGRLPRGAMPADPTNLPRLDPAVIMKLIQTVMGGNGRGIPTGVPVPGITGGPAPVDNRVPTMNRIESLPVGQGGRPAPGGGQFDPDAGSLPPVGGGVIPQLRFDPSGKPPGGLVGSAQAAEGGPPRGKSRGMVPPPPAPDDTMDRITGLPIYQKGETPAPAGNRGADLTGVKGNEPTGVHKLALEAAEPLNRGVSGVIEAQVDAQAKDASKLEDDQNSYGKDESYTVVKGDTLTSIANKMGTSVQALARANGLKNANKLQFGRTLIVPSIVGGAGEAKTNYKKSKLQDFAKKGFKAPKPKVRPNR